MDRKYISKRLFIWYAALWILLFIALYLAYGVYFVDTMSTKSKWVGVFAGAIALLVAACKVMEMSFYKSNNPMFEKITKYFLSGSLVFVKRLSKLSLVFVFLISCLLIKPMGNNFVICFVSGSVFSIALIFITTILSTKIATRSSQFYNESDILALKQMHNSGVAISLITCALMIIPAVILFHITKDYQIINGFVFGSVLIFIINNISTVISRQAVQGAQNVVVDNVSELEVNDRRNPLLLLSGVVKSILSVNVLSGDLYVSCALALFSAMAIGGSFYQLMGAFLPIIVLASGIFASLISALLINFKSTNSLIKKLFMSAFFANLLLVLVSYYLVKQWLPGMTELVISIAIGAFGGFVLCFANINIVNSKYRPALNVSNAAITGFIPAFKQMIKESFSSIFSPVLILALCFVLSFVLAQGIQEPSMGLYGLSLSILSMLSCMSIMIGISSFGMTTKNVSIVLDTYGEDICDKQNILSNSLQEYGFYAISLCKNFVNSASILTTIIALIAYTILVNLEQVDIVNPYVLTALLIGASIPFLYSASILGIVSKTARRLALEVKNQIKSAPQILRFEIRPDYEKCCEVAALNSSIQVVIYTLVVVLIFFSVLKFLDIEALMGFVFGVMLSSIGLLYMTSSASILGKSTKKYFEKQFDCSKNFEEYEAISINDAIFSAFKELINPTLNILIKFLAILALVLAPMLI